MPSPQIDLSQLGIASIIKQNQLAVEPNQRDYSWTDKEVKTLLQDFAYALSEGEDKPYFLGTIVTIPRADGTLEVIDGQQRLATTAIMLAEMKTYLASSDNAMLAASIDEFLFTTDRKRLARVPRVRLNLDDNEYFRSKITGDGAAAPVRQSHALIDGAFGEAAAQVRNIVAGYDPKNHGEVLERWITFMESRAVAVLLKVSTGADAYRMFETLNDRGLRTTQADLIKSYLFGRAGDERMREVQQKWALMRGALEGIEDEEITITFLRHALTVLTGFTRGASTYERVQAIAKAPQPTVQLATRLEALAYAYVATYNSANESWNKYSHATKRAIDVLNQFDIAPMRPLLLSIAMKFSPREAEAAFRLCVSIGVRLLITNGTRTGTVEEGLAGTAHRVFDGTIADTKKMIGDMKPWTPMDERFQAAFERATVSSQKLARYYLRSLEMEAKSEPDPWHIPNDDASQINLEHILPQRKELAWPQFTDEQAKLFARRIGNLCLVRARDNSKSKSVSFEDKRQIYLDSDAFVLTKQVGEAEQWRAEEITQRQRTLAQIAVRAWPI